jgi:hypothetical protein
MLSCQFPCDAAHLGPANGGKRPVGVADFVRLT